MGAGFCPQLNNGLDQIREEMCDARAHSSVIILKFLNNKFVCGVKFYVSII